jgi:hypothetical protein
MLPDEKLLSIALTGLRLQGVCVQTLMLACRPYVDSTAIADLRLR